MVELLITMAILGILMAITASALAQYREKLRADNFLASLASDFNVSRSRTLSTGAPRRITLVSNTQYTIEEQGSTGWSTIRTATFNKSILDLTNTSARVYTFNDRGSVSAINGAGSPTTSTNILSLLGSGARRLTVTALGIARRE